MSRLKTPRQRQKSVLPDFVAPCLASLCKAPPHGPLWLHEIKFDGYRIQARLENGDVRLLTRNGLDWTGRFAHIAKALGKLNVKSALLDGEVVVEDDAGRSSFEKLVGELKAGRSAAMTLYLFDLLHLDGTDTRALPLADRKSLLEAAIAPLPKSGAIRFSQHIESEGPAMLAHVCKLGLEGIVSKRADKPYRSGRGADWLKSKCLQSDEFVIGGYLPHAALKEAIGSLLLGYFDGRTFVYAGRVGTGFTQRMASDLWAILQPLRSAAAPFSARLTAAQRKGVVWVKPHIVAQIGYRAITSDNLLRHASFKCLREDKTARDAGRPHFVR